MNVSMDVIGLLDSENAVKWMLTPTTGWSLRLSTHSTSPASTWLAAASGTRPLELDAPRPARWWTGDRANRASRPSVLRTAAAVAAGIRRLMRALLLGLVVG